jgi:hypothetical protein
MSFGTRFLKSLSQNWWVLYWIATIVIFFASIQWGILAVVLFVVIAVFLVFVKKRKKSSISRNLLGIEKIGERDLARLAGVYIEEAHAFLHDVSRNPEASGIPILIKGEYIYFSNEVIKKFKKLYKEGKNTKELIEEMPQFETREEVKKMLEKLKEFDELPARKKEGVTDQSPTTATEETDTEEAEKTPTKKNPLREVHPAFGVIAAAIAVILFVAASVSLNNGTMDTVIVSTTYHAWLEEISNATGYGLLLLAVGFVLGFLARRKALLAALCLSIAFALSIVLYINNFRPYMEVIPVNVSLDALQALKTLVGSLEAIVIISAVVGIVAEINNLRQATR